MSHLRIGLHKKVHREAENLFRRLSRTTNGPVAEINFAQRFSDGQCFITIVIPIEKMPVRTVSMVVAANQHYRTKPTIINNRRGRCLRLAYRFKGVKASEQVRLKSYVKMLSAWVQETFDLSVNVIQIPGAVELRRKNRMYSPEV